MCHAKAIAITGLTCWALAGLVFLAAGVAHIVETLSARRHSRRQP
ncbi:hypothetical protein BX257_4770 [Streptomyces sp. 3212.3]|nr:hypothetical protein [Streptomyces sp. 3212.3]REE62157.1 hypothetical protein BX257_4770 [Streptomyces sp. 3212.3]